MNNAGIIIIVTAGPATAGGDVGTDETLWTENAVDLATETGSVLITGMRLFDLETETGDDLMTESGAILQAAREP